MLHFTLAATAALFLAKSALSAPVPGYTWVSRQNPLLLELLSATLTGRRLQTHRFSLSTVRATMERMVVTLTPSPDFLLCNMGKLED